MRTGMSFAALRRQAGSTVLTARDGLDAGMRMGNEMMALLGDWTVAVTRDQIGATVSTATQTVETLESLASLAMAIQGSMTRRTLDHLRTNLGILAQSALATFEGALDVVIWPLLHQITTTSRPAGLPGVGR